MLAALMFCVVWVLVSLPFGIAVGCAIHYGGHEAHGRQPRRREANPNE